MSLALCKHCEHDVTFHAMATQGQTNLPCEYPSCDCHDFTEPNPATVPSGSGMPDLTNLVHETLYEDKTAPLPADWIPPFSADPESGGMWAVTGTAFDPPVYMTDDSEKAFCITDALNAVHSPTGELTTLRTQLAASQAECERLRKVVRELVKAGELASITVQDFMNDLRERDAEIERLNSTLDGLRCKDCNERFDDDGCCTPTTARKGETMPASDTPPTTANLERYSATGYSLDEVRRATQPGTKPE